MFELQLNSGGRCCRSLGVAVVVLLACALLALSMSQKMVLQHHYGHHMFGDDLAQGAKLSMRSHNRHHPPPRTGLRGTVKDVVEEVEAGVATVEERLADELRGYQRAPPGMEPQAIVKVAWGDATEQPRPQFAFLCSAAPMLLDAQQVGLRGGRQAPPAGRGEACVFLASFDGEWEHLVDGEAAPAFRPARPLDTGEHTLRVRAVDGRGYVQIAPTLFRFTVDALDEGPSHREIRWATPTAGAAGSGAAQETGGGAAQETGGGAIDGADATTHAAIAMHDSAVADAVSSGDAGYGWQKRGGSEGEVNAPGGQHAQHGTAALVESMIAPQ